MNDIVATESDDEWDYSDTTIAYSGIYRETEEALDIWWEEYVQEVKKAIAEIQDILKFWQNLEGNKEHLEEWLMNSQDDLETIKDETSFIEFRKQYLGIN